MTKKATRAGHRPKKPTTTAIRAFGQTWHVPRGFGRVYRRFVKEDERNIACGTPGKITLDTITILELVGYTSTVHVVADWPARKRIEAVIWAATEHARAGDNPVRRFPKPAWLTAKAWAGPELGEGIWKAPSPTPIEVAP